MSSELVLAFVRGQIGASALKAAGFSVESKPADPQHLTWRVNARSKHELAARPAATDLAAGILRLQSEPQRLREWGTFILVSDAIDLQEVEQDPSGDSLLECVWDASFNGKIEPEAISLAMKVATPKESS